MRLVSDNATQAAALHTIRELIDAGLAGNDCYDHDIFVVDAPKEQRDFADVALDLLGAQMIRDGAYGTPKRMLQCRLPHWVVRELGLDRLNAPTIVMPLASRGIGATVGERELGGATALVMDRLIDTVTGKAS